MVPATSIGEGIEVSEGGTKGLLGGFGVFIVAVPLKSGLLEAGRSRIIAGEGARGEITLAGPMMDSWWMISIRPCK